MRGTLRHRGTPGSWEYRLELGVQPAQKCPACGKYIWVESRPFDACPACGASELVEISKRREQTVGGFRTEREAQRALDKAKQTFEDGTYIEPSKLTVAAYLNTWLSGIGANVGPATVRSYTIHCERHIIPRIGRVRLQQLSADAIAAMESDLLTSLAPGTVRLTHIVLHRALKNAVERGHLAPRNPADAVKAPRLRRAYRTADVDRGAGGGLPRRDPRRPSRRPLAPAGHDRPAPWRGARLAVG